VAIASRVASFNMTGGFSVGLGGGKLLRFCSQSGEPPGAPGSSADCASPTKLFRPTASFLVACGSGGWGPPLRSCVELPPGYFSPAKRSWMSCWISA